MTETGPVTVTDSGYTVTSTSETADQITDSLAEPVKEVDPVSEAASTLGKHSAAARKGKDGLGSTDETGEPAADDVQPDSTGTSDAEPDKPLGKPRHDPKARMLEATRKEAEAKREAKAAREEAAGLKARLEALEAAKAPQKATEKAPEAVPGKPQLADFATHEEWVEALTDWKTEQKFQAREVKAAQEAQVKQYASSIDEQLGKAVAARNEYIKTDPQFIQKVSEEVKALANNPSFARELTEPLGPDHVIADEIILAGQAGPPLMLHLSQDQNELQRLRALRTPSEIQVEMRLLARSLNGVVTAGATSKGEVSQAKPPVRPVTGSPHTADPVPGENAPYEEHARYWNAKERHAR